MRSMLLTCIRARLLIVSVAALSVLLVRAATADVCLDNGSLHSTTNAVTGDPPFAIQSCDLNGDGRPDLATANDASDTVTVLVNLGDGSFSQPEQWSVGGDVEPVHLACCDIDGDTLFDLVTANHTSDDVSILFNEGNIDGVPQFSTPIRYPVGEAPWAVRCLPVDTDEHVDLVVANFTSDSVSVLLNAGDGTFDPADAYDIPVGDGPRSLAVCDVDGDLDQDFIAGNFAGKSVTVLRNDGVAGIVKIADYFVGVNPYNITCCELDGAGGVDIVTANLIDDSISVLANNGSGTFGAPARYTTADGANAVACVDLNGDGSNDIVTANLGSDDLAIFLNDNNGSFLAPAYKPVGTNPSSMVAADLSGNGSPDLAVAFGDGAKVFHNTCSAECIVDSECPDDGSHCNGSEVCNNGTCVSTGDPCGGTTTMCCEATDICVAECCDDSECPDDGSYCNGSEVCNNGTCVSSGDPCGGTTTMCCEATDICVAECCDDSECPDDGSYCNGSEVCDNGTCVSTGDPCGGSTATCCEATDICVTECCADSDCPDDGSYCNGSEVCNNGTCVSTGSPCDEPRSACWEDTDTCGLPGDFDRDGDSDLMDFTFLQACFGLMAPLAKCASADLNDDGKINLDDHAVMSVGFDGPK